MGEVKPNEARREMSAGFLLHKVTRAGMFRCLSAHLVHPHGVPGRNGRTRRRLTLAYNFRQDRFAQSDELEAAKAAGVDLDRLSKRLHNLAMADAVPFVDQAVAALIKRSSDRF
jgi:hypothetical protein